MSIKSSINYMRHADYIALFQKSVAPRGASNTLKCKAIARQSATWMIVGETENIISFYNDRPDLWKTETMIEWDARHNVAEVLEEAKRHNLHCHPLHIKYEDIPLSTHNERSEWLEQTACKLLSQLIGEAVEWTGRKRREKGSYYPDGTSASGKKLEVKGLDSVMSVWSSRQVKQHQSGTEE